MGPDDVLLARAEKLWWGGNPSAALALLQPFRNDPGASPRARLLLAKVLRAAGQPDESRALALALVQDDSTELAAWEILLFACLEQPEFLHLAPGFLNVLKASDVLDRKSLRRPLILALIQVHPDATEALVGKALKGGVLSGDEADLVLRAGDFLRRLTQGLASLGSPPDSWSLGLCGTDQVLLFHNGHALVDLSFFRGGREAGWTIEAARALARAVVALLPPARFDDRDARRVSGPDLTEADHLPAMLLSPLLALPRAILGLDPDVRHAGRPMALPEGALVLRAGWVETWALAGWARDRRAALAAAELAARQASDALTAGRDWRDKTPGWPRLDLVANATYLATNAGFYAPPETAAACLDDWANHYLSALLAGDLLVECAEVLQRLATHVPALRQKPLHDWSDTAFLAALRGKRLVIASPFWREIAGNWSEGRLARLWQAAGLVPDLAGLETVPAPVSIWPHSPDKDWSASFARLERDCQAAIRQSGAQVFIASCGCYGLPIVHAMHQANPGLTSLYNGHASNAWFGILTNDAASHVLHRQAPDPALWARVDLESRFPGMARIDEGRYVIETPAQD